MGTVYVSLPTAETVQEFVECLAGLEGSFDLISDGHILDARSLMGIFTLDLSRPIRLDFSRDTPETRMVLAGFTARAPKNSEVQHG
jgi:hypothetical protein